ncbi:MAG: DHHW family protein [Bacillota bacterium]|nr:DHHW family protein [Bacillota bacterium]
MKKNMYLTGFIILLLVVGGIYYLCTDKSGVPAVFHRSETADNNGYSQEVTNEGETKEASTENQKSGINQIEQENLKSLAVETAGHNDEGRMIGNMLVWENRAMEVHIYNPDACVAYADTINEFTSEVSEDVKVYSLFAPTQIEFLPNDIVKKYSASQKNSIDLVNENFNDEVITVDAYTELNKHADEYLYFRTDHHWTALGAYYAYSAFMQEMGEKAVPIDQYSTVQVDDFLGSTYTATSSEALVNHPDTMYLYPPFIDHEYYAYYEGPIRMPLLDMSQAESEKKYGVFLSGDRPWGKIITSIKNGKKIAVIKDSYGNAFVPFLLPHYEEIYIIDPRQFKLNVFDFVRENGIQDVLFLNYALVTRYTGWSDLLNQIMMN